MAALASISNRLTTAQSQLLERSRILSLGMHPSAAATTQIVRALAGVKKELSRVEDEAELERAGLVVGGGNKGRSAQLDEDERALEALGERYDRLVEMLGKDEDGRERAKGLVREKR
jgi:syntaxin 8